MMGEASDERTTEFWGGWQRNSAGRVPGVAVSMGNGNASTEVAVTKIGGHWQTAPFLFPSTP